jgi:hypothetical protein
LDLAEDEIGTSGADEWLGVLVAVVEILKHGFLQGVNGGVASTTYAPFGDFSKQPFNEIEPASAGWREVDVITRVSGQPVLNLGHFVCAVVVQHQVDIEATSGLFQ